jgi:hypothetical protein
MSDHSLGAQLRDILIRNQQRGLPLDSRRLQGLVGDLCGAGEQALLPPLRHLVLSPAFLSAATATPPFADGRMRFRLVNELRSIFAAPLCERMEAVIDGLLGLPAPAREGAAPAWEGAAPAWEGPAPAQPGGPTPLSIAPEPEATGPLAELVTPAAPPIRPPWIAALLGFLSGSLLLGGAGLLVWMHNNRIPSPAGRPIAPSPAAPNPAAPSLGAPLASPAESPPAGPAAAIPAPADPVETPPAPELPPTGSGQATQGGKDNPIAAMPSPDGVEASTQAAIGAVEGLYAALSRQDYATARSAFSTEAADQFNPAFFGQFARVAVEGLHQTGRDNASINLQGVVRFEYPDGSVQKESRSFRVDTTQYPPKISASAFGAVLSPRRKGN